MFWKLAVTATVVLLIAGRTPSLRNPLVRLLVPRSWASVLSALPGGLASPPRRRPGQAPEAEPTRRWFGRRARLVLIGVVLAGLAAWTATRVMIARQSDVAADASSP